MRRVLNPITRKTREKNICLTCIFCITCIENSLSVIPWLVLEDLFQENKKKAMCSRWQAIIWFRCWLECPLLHAWIPISIRSITMWLVRKPWEHHAVLILIEALSYTPRYAPCLETDRCCVFFGQELSSVLLDTARSPLMEIWAAQHFFLH